MRTPRQRGWASTALALSATLILLGNSPLHAEEKITPKPSSSALAAALQMTRTRGVATVAVLTSSEQPSSVRFWNELNNGAWARMNRGLVQVVNVSKDAEPALVRTMGAIRFPTVIVYARGPRGVTQLGTIADCDTAEAMVDRLRSLDLKINPPAKADRAVSPTAFGGDIYPSQQVSPPPPVSAPPVTTRTSASTDGRVSDAFGPGDGQPAPDAQSEPHDSTGAAPGLPGTDASPCCLCASGDECSPRRERSPCAGSHRESLHDRPERSSGPGAPAERGSGGGSHCFGRPPGGGSGGGSQCCGRPPGGSRSGSGWPACTGGRK